MVKEEAAFVETVRAEVLLTDERPGGSGVVHATPVPGSAGC